MVVFANDSEMRNSEFGGEAGYLRARVSAVWDPVVHLLSLL